MSDAIAMDLAETLLARLGLNERPAQSLSGLNALYRAWCKHVPFDNVQKRLHVQARRTDPLPGGEPTQFFGKYLRHGTGGTCWPTSAALFALARALGFSVRRAAGSMLGTPDHNFPNHGTIIAVVENKPYLLDSSMLSEEVLPLVRGEPSATADPVYGLRAEPLGDLWTIFWKPGHSRDDIECRLEHAAVDHDFYLRRYATTRAVSLFNTALYARKNTPEGGIIAIGRGHFITIGPQNHVSVTPVGGDRDALLIERFGFSEEIVACLPEDTAGDTLG